MTAIVLVAFGVAALVMGINGHDTVGNNLKQEQITGTADMTPAAIAPEDEDDDDVIEAILED